MKYIITILFCLISIKASTLELTLSQGTVKPTPIAITNLYSTDSSLEKLGENISSVEVEGILHRHEAVALAAVVAMKDEKWGEVPCAFIELKDGKSVTENEIISFCRDHLAGFKRPKKVVFGVLPKTATGKIQKYELRNNI